mmetsp:Transcript_30207/g.92402  ORF Transcript_30207/g.92402 Transcript_30207/m.92402 type:complete len:276 (+) Transcript_30207:183-1010(+)
MEVWQRKYPAATMLCVCVEGRRVAMRFGGESCLNGYLEDDGPSFPAQLGCQGFVILDKEGRFVTSRTKAWNQYRDEAYQEVEGHLARLLHQKAPESSVSVSSVTRVARAGDAVQLFGLTRDDEALNGLVGVVAEERDDKYAVRLEQPLATTVLISPLNLVRAGPLATVSNDAMDHEHATLVQLLSAACREPSRASVLAVRDFFAAHADHEEQLLAAIQKKPGTFSALDTHVADHARVIGIADAAVAAPTAERLRALSAAIYDHADNFDSKYAGAL